jgi:hypothetical protein
MNLVYFLGRFHVLVLHLPIALVLAAVVLEWLSRREKYRQLDQALGLLWAATAITAVVTVILGYMHFSEGGFTGPSAVAHRAFGTAIAVVATLAWALRAFSKTGWRMARVPVSLALLVLVTMTGHYGGNLTHGDTFLVEYAPAPIQALAGMEARRAPVTDLAMADPYLDIVRPILSQRCFSCHNDDKQRGDLNLAHYESLMKGGEKGPIVVAGNLKESDLHRRITLPSDHDDFMPAEGKTPLTQEQVAIIGWWISEGAKTGAPLGKTPIPPAIEPLLLAQLGVGADKPGGATAKATAQPMDPQLQAKFAASGFLARKVSLTSSELIIGPLAAGTPFSSEQIGELQGSAAQIIELDLQRAKLDDAALAPIGRFANLTHLRLDNNRLSDRAVETLAALPKLKYLNLYGNAAITDKSVEALARMPALEAVYLWGTGVTEQGAKRLRELKPDLQVILAVSADNVST